MSSNVEDSGDETTEQEDTRTLQITSSPEKRLAKSYAHAEALNHGFTVLRLGGVLSYLPGSIKPQMKRRRILSRCEALPLPGKDKQGHDAFGEGAELVQGLRSSRVVFIGFVPLRL